MNKLPIRIVCATRLNREDFIKTSFTGASANSYCEIEQVQLRLFENNSIGLGEVYNIAIQEAIDKPAILVFVHDDVFLLDYYWTFTIRNSLNQYDIVGVVGNTRRLPNQPSWIIVNSETLELDDKANLSGSIGQGVGFPPKKIDVFGLPGRECKLLDGVMLAVKSQTLVDSGLRFDPIFKFHFYDMDFCRSAEKLGLRMGVSPVPLAHASYGNLDINWRRSYDDYLSKWKG